MIMPSWKQRSELITIAACSCAFGAIMLEVGIYAGQRDLQAVTAIAGSKEIRRALTSDGLEADISDESTNLLGSPQADSRLREVDYEFRVMVRHVLGLREILVKRQSDKSALISACEAADAELRTATLQLEILRDRLASELLAEQEAPKESKDANSTNVGDSG